MTCRVIAYPAEVRFQKYVSPEPNSGCWLWTGALFKTTGYGAFRFRGRTTVAHRVSWLLHKGVIPEGLYIDHLCRVRSCVNPDHLEPVTNRENILRGNSPSARQAARTHCIYGHPLSGPNLYSPKANRRQCRMCNQRRSQKRYAHSKQRRSNVA